MVTKPLLSMLILALWWTPAIAQSLRVLQGRQITESALIDALSPAPDAIVTRSIHPDAAKTAQKPAAALLITFQTNSSALTPQAKRELVIVGQALNNLRLVNFNFVIEGHADPRGSPESNLALSRERAEAVRNYLVETQNVRAARLSPVGKGDREPLNLTDLGAPENRRVTFVNVSQ
jgi:OOP family OmpA-OmpF porin